MVSLIHSIFCIYSNRLTGTVAPGETQEVSIMLHEPARPHADQVIADIQGHGNAQLLSSMDGVLHMIFGAADLDRIAALESVQAIETITPAKPYNDAIKEISGINSINTELQTN